MKKFDADRFLNSLIDDVASSEGAGKPYEANPAILGPLLVSLQMELREIKKANLTELLHLAIYGAGEDEK